MNREPSVFSDIEIDGEKLIECLTTQVFLAVETIISYREQLQNAFDKQNISRKTIKKQLQRTIWRAYEEGLCFFSENIVTFETDNKVVDFLRIILESVSINATATLSEYENTCLLIKNRDIGHIVHIVFAGREIQVGALKQENDDWIEKKPADSAVSPNHSDLKKEETERKELDIQLSEVSQLISELSHSNDETKPAYPLDSEADRELREFVAGKTDNVLPCSSSDTIRDKVAVLDTIFPCDTNYCKENDMNKSSVNHSVDNVSENISGCEHKFVGDRDNVSEFNSCAEMSISESQNNTDVEDVASLENDSSKKRVLNEATPLAVCKKMKIDDTLIAKKKMVYDENIEISDISDDDDDINNSVVSSAKTENENENDSDDETYGFSMKGVRIDELLNYVDTYVKKDIVNDIELLQNTIKSCLKNLNVIEAYVAKLNKLCENIPYSMNKKTGEIKIKCKCCPLHCIGMIPLKFPIGRPNKKSSRKNMK